jgi:hypothetical protein
VEQPRQSGICRVCGGAWPWRCRSSARRRIGADSRPQVQQASFDHAYAIADWVQPEGPYRASRVYGPNMAIRASVFHAGWSFDPAIGPDGTDTYIPGSETDPTMRLERAGFPAVYLPRALVLHQIRAEQLGLEWLSQRAFRKGREDLRHRAPSPAANIRSVNGAVGDGTTASPNTRE